MSFQCVSRQESNVMIYLALKYGAANIANPRQVHGAGMSSHILGLIHTFLLSNAWPVGR
jgi:hypothetical protein